MSTLSRLFEIIDCFHNGRFAFFITAGAVVSFAWDTVCYVGLTDSLPVFVWLFICLFFWLESALVGVLERSACGDWRECIATGRCINSGPKGVARVVTEAAYGWRSDEGKRRGTETNLSASAGVDCIIFTNEG